MTRPDLNVIADRWYDPLYRFALSLCHNPDDALDLTQAAFYKLTEKIDEIRDPSRIKSWLFSVVHRAYIDQYRHHSRFPKDTIDAVPEPVEAPKNRPGERADAEVVLQAMQTLDERFRAPLSLYYLNDFAYRDIAEALEIPIGTVMSRLRRAKDQLRAALETPAEQHPTIPFQKEARHG